MTVDYTYDVDGTRIGKTVTSGGKTTAHKYYTQDSKIVAETRGGDKLEYLYADNGRPLAMILNGTKYDYVTNLQGDVIQIRDAANNVAASYEYNAFGELINSSGDASILKANPLRYRGYYYDTETGFYLTGTRYYDPVTCRFINADAVDVLYADHESFLQYNLFTYCWNNPVNLSDETGEWPSWATKVLVGVAVIAACAIVTVVTVATGGAAAGVAGYIAAGALKGAVIGANQVPLLERVQAQ